jgi:hypothetical protein
MPAKRGTTRSIERTLAQKLRLHAKASQRQVSGSAAVIADDRRAEKESKRRQNHQSR